MHSSTDTPICTKYIIQGTPHTPFEGSVRCFGAKNVAVKAIIVALLAKTPSFLRNIPNIGDVKVSWQLLNDLGVKYSLKDQDDNGYTIDPSGLKNISSLASTNRTSISLFGILAHFFNYAKLPVVGGCNLGARSVDFHFEIYKQFGLQLIEHTDHYEMIKPGTSADQSLKRLEGQIITLPYPSIGATETALFCAVLAKGRSVISNIAVEPEIIEIVSMLQMMGAQIIFTDKRTLEVYGVEELHGTTFDIIPDRLELVTWAILAALSNGRINVSGIKPENLQTFLGHFLHLGGGMKYINTNQVEFFRASGLKYANVSTAIYPSLATDQLAPLATIMGMAKGISTIHETVYENRINVIHDMLEHFGIQSTKYVYCLGHECRFVGQNHVHSLAITGKEAIAAPNYEVLLPKNIRCAHSYMLLASRAQGTSVLLDPTDSIARGYGVDLVNKLRAVGIQIEAEKIETEKIIFLRDAYKA